MSSVDNARGTTVIGNAFRRVKLFDCKSALTPSTPPPPPTHTHTVVYTADCYKAVVPFLLLFRVAL